MGYHTRLAAMPKRAKPCLAQEQCFHSQNGFRKLARKDRRSDVIDKINDHLLVFNLKTGRRNSAYSFEQKHITKAPKTGAFVMLECVRAHVILSARPKGTPLRKNLLNTVLKLSLTLRDSSLCSE